MTTIYFVRHCKPDANIQDDRNRPLTEEGFADSQQVLEILKDKNIDIFISSPYKRSYDSIKKAADYYGKNIITDDYAFELNEELKRNALLLYQTFRAVKKEMA